MHILEVVVQIPVSNGIHSNLGLHLRNNIHNTMEGQCLLPLLATWTERENLEALEGTMGSATPGFIAFLNNRVTMLLTSSAEQGLEGLWIKITRQAKDGRRCLA